jgi:hypothetical protein
MNEITGRVVGLAIAAVAGILAVVVGAAGGMPGAGWFLPAGIAAGIVAALVAPGWAGLAAVLGGMIVANALTIGIVQFGTAVFAILMSYGAVVGVALRRIVVPPTAPWWRDPATWGWTGAAVGGGAVLAWLSIDMAANPF